MRPGGLNALLLPILVASTLAAPIPSIDNTPTARTRAAPADRRSLRGNDMSGVKAAAKDPFRDVYGNPMPSGPGLRNDNTLGGTHKPGTSQDTIRDDSRDDNVKDYTHNRAWAKQWMQPGKHP